MESSTDGLLDLRSNLLRPILRLPRPKTSPNRKTIYPRRVQHLFKIHVVHDRQLSSHTILTVFNAFPEHG